jgi:hypothetical protein
MRCKLHAPAFVLMCSLFLLVPAASGAVYLGVSDTQAYHAPGTGLGIGVSIKYDQYVPHNSVLRAYINGGLEGTMGLEDYLHGTSYYDYRTHPFSYNITATGRNAWDDYPEVSFDYRVSVWGLKGTGCSESWSFSRDYIDNEVSAGDGLKFIFNVSNDIIVPRDCPQYTQWSVTVTSRTPSAASVEVSLREACGRETYGYPTDSNGWILRTLDLSGCSGLLGTRECYIHPFSNQSLRENPGVLGMPQGWEHGGIYRDNVYQRWELGEVKWDGKTGLVVVNDYSSQSRYDMVYLPPQGPRVCAYTDYAVQESEDWSRNKTIAGSADYMNPYGKDWSETQLKSGSMLGIPACPCSGCNCVSTSQYSVREYRDPDSAVTVSSAESVSGGEKHLLVTGTCSLMDFTDNYTASVGLEDYVESPGTSGTYNLTLILADGATTLASAYRQLSVCADLDGDGYCSESGDCNDTDPSVNPGAEEACNGLDDDCDGDIDEDFYGAGFACVIGSSCNDWSGSVCGGTCSCTADGTNVTCNSTYSPGELDEVCINGLDDDCDGETDEMFVMVNGSEEQACVFRCEEGSTINCSSNIGFCTPGKRTCVDGSWGPCLGARLAREETCNLALNQVPRYADDDCDGVIDNVNKGKSVEETRCGCYGGGSPKPEECNGVDDDCDGKIDEMVCRCSGGETRYCGNDEGVCEYGIQNCVDGYWETDCNGGVGPDPAGEICYNGLDDDCDGQEDEGCNLEATCRNGIWDLNEDGLDCGGACGNPCQYPLPWMMVGAGVIILIVLFVVLTLRGKIPM